MKKIGLILIISLLILFSANSVFAGFGVSPPKVLNYHLLPGSHFEQTIYLVQGKPEKDLVAKIEIDAPEIKDWIIIDRGLEFTIPAGVQQFPITVYVDVPNNAAFKHYSGQMWIKTQPKERAEGMVTVAYGGIVTFDLEVSAEAIYGFVARGLDINNVEEGRPIKIGISLQNVGNTKDRPTKIHLDIYDEYRNQVLYSGDATNLAYVGPFETKTITGKFRTKLEIGSYWADVKVYKNENILSQDKRVFQVVKRTGLMYKIFSHWYSWIILVILILAAAAIKRQQQLQEWFKKWRTKIKKRKRIRLEKKLKKLEK